MNVLIQKGIAKGTVVAPPSKSIAHRALICAGLCDGVSILHRISHSQDMLATIDCLEALGAKVVTNGDTAIVTGIPSIHTNNKRIFPCRESGSTLRFFLPLAMLSACTDLFEGSQRLMERPQTIYEDICSSRHIPFARGNNQISVGGQLTSGSFSIQGNVSSQFISGLLFALPLCSGNSTIHLLPPLESGSYIELTLSVLKAFGIEVERDTPESLHILGNQRYRAQEMTIEGDCSNAAFFGALNFLGGNIILRGLNPKTKQGDRIWEELMEQLTEANPVIDLGDCPDLGPILFALAATKNGSFFTGTRRLRIKESDRAQAMAEELKKCGVNITVTENTVTVPKGKLHAPSIPIDSHNDHRIVMAMACLLTQLGGEITGCEAVSKSMPDFFDKLKLLGIGME